MIVSTINCALYVFAEEINSDVETNIETEEEYEEAEILYEDLSARTEFSKTYLMSDGSFQMNIFNYSVHHQNEDGEWVENNSTSVRRTRSTSVTNNSNIEATYVSTTELNQNYNNENVINLSETNIGLINPFESTGDTSGYYITNAELKLESNIINSDTYIYAYKILEPWDAETVTYSNMPEISEEVIDYYYDSNDVSFDITNLIYTNSFYGIALMSSDEVSFSKAENQIMVTMSYIITSGIKEEYESLEYDLDSAGQAYINKQSGNLVLKHDDISTGNDTNSYDVSSVFNSLVGFSQTETSQWMHNCDSFVAFLGLLFVDENGTVTRLDIERLEDDYRILSKNEYGFEKLRILENVDIPFQHDYGNGIVSTGHLTLPSVYEVIANEGKTKYLFDRDLGLSAIFKINEDETETTVLLKEKVNDNTVDIYDGDDNKIRIVTEDTKITMTQVLSDGSTGDVEVLLLDDNSNIIEISKNNVLLSEYTYDELKRITSVTNNTGYKLVFTYKENTGVIESVQEFKNNTAGQKIGYDRTFNKCKERTAGPDDVYGTEDDVITTYTFDQECRVTCLKSEVAGEYDLGSVSYEYDDEDITGAAFSGRSVSNFFKNHNFETNSGWTNIQSENTDNAISFTTNEHYYGNKSLKIDVSNNNEAAECGVFQNFAMSNNSILKSNEIYTVSTYVKIEEPITKKANVESDNYGACIKISIPNSEDEPETIYSEKLISTEGEWERICMFFTIPESCNNVKISLEILNGIGTAYFDASILESGMTPSKYNLLENNGFDYTDTSWSSINLNSSDIISNSKMNISGSVNAEKSIYQDVFLNNAVQEDTYVLSGNAYATTVPLRGERKFELTAEVFYSDENNILSPETKVINCSFSSYTNDTQYKQIGFDLTTTNTELKPFKIRVSAVYNYNQNEAFFEDISLFKSHNVFILSDEDEQSDLNNYVYNDDGTVASYTDEEGNTTIYSYENGIRTAVETKNSNNEVIYSALYNSNGDLVSEEKEDRITTYTYTNNTLQRIETRENENIISYSNYNSNGNIVVEFSNGNTTNYHYYDNDTLNYYITTNSNNEIVFGERYNEDGYLVITFNNETAVSYFYDDEHNVSKKSYGTVNFNVDENNEITFEISNEKDVEFLYDDGKCISVLRNGLEYTYLYDDWGNITTTKLNDEITLEENTYNSNGSICLKEYGNGDNETYFYNFFGQIEGINRNDDSYGYLYDLDGNIIFKADGEDDISFCKYDENGNFVGENATRFSENDFSFDTINKYRVKYDNDGHVIRESVYSKTGYVSTEKTYSETADNHLQIEIDYGNSNIITNYDENGTIQGKTSDVNETYTYNNDGYPATHTIGNDIYSYTYDDKGNIVSVCKNGLLQNSYEYDAFGQLVRENNLALNKTYIYNYDDGGNILSKKEYLYTLGELSGEYSTTEYEYDPNLTDLLLNYSDDSIVYDNAGNPTSYRGAACTYNGRQLCTYTKGSTSVSYKYDGEGLRKSKTVNGVKYDYYYVDSVLLYEKRENDYELFYRYDNEGKLAFITRIKTSTNSQEDFKVLTNIQGDVIKILNNDCSVVADYSYDAWGNVTVNSTNDIAMQNSIRYRGYVYDSETEMYYLQSRYYDPETGRFINCDAPNYIGASDMFTSWNAFTYCGNEPVNRMDPSGYIEINATISVREIYSYVYVYLYDFSLQTYSNHLDFSIDEQIYSYGSNGANIITKIVNKADGYLSRNSVKKWHSSMKPKSTVKLGLTKDEYTTLVLSLSLFIISNVSSENIGKKTTRIYKVISGKYAKYNFLYANCSTFVRDFIFQSVPALFAKYKGMSYNNLCTPTTVFNAIKKKGVVIK